MNPTGGNLNPRQLLQKVGQLLQAASSSKTGASGSPAPIAQPGGLPSGPNAQQMFQQLLGLHTQMSPAQTSQLLKSMMRMPEGFQQFLVMMLGNAQTAGKPGAQAALLQTLLAEAGQEGTISLERLQAMLGKQSKAGVNQLMRMVQSQPAMAYTGDSQQLTELLNQTASVLSRASQSPTDALQTLFLLYIPWYPLELPQRLDLAFERMSGEAEEDDEAPEALVVYLETNTLGKFRMAVRLKQQTEINATVEHDPQADAHLEAIEVDVADTLKRDGLPPPVFAYHARPQAADPQSNRATEPKAGVDEFHVPTASDDQRRISVHPAKGMPVLALNASYVWVRTVFETDERNQTLSLRAERSKASH